MKQPTSWLSPEKKPPDVQTLTQNELLDVWAANRNNLISVLAAEEMMRRLFDQRQETKK
jgi:hypothetical protein